MTPEPPPRDPQLPAIVVEAERQYLMGLPILVAVTFDNPPGGDQFFDLPELDMFFSHGPVGVQLTPVAGGNSIGFPPPYPREGIGGMTMGPGEQRRMLLDLSNFGLTIPPGRYWLALTLKVARYTRDSAPVEIEFVQPSPTDVAEAERLRRMADVPTDTGAWAPFVLKNWNTVAVSPGLSVQARRQLALHLFVHEAIYGPVPVSQLSLASLRQIAPPILQGEVSALEWEVRAAANPRAALDIRALPGLEFRLDRIRRGAGFLTRYRKAVGAERDFLHQPKFMPYRQ